MRVRSWRTTAPAPRLRCPTSELPICPSGSPTARAARRQLRVRVARPRARRSTGVSRERDRVAGPVRGEAPAVEHDEAQRAARAGRRDRRRTAHQRGGRDDRRERLGLQRGAADERAVDVRQREQLGRVVGLDGAAVEDPRGLRGRLRVAIADERAHERARLLRLLRRRDLARCRSPRSARRRSPRPASRSTGNVSRDPPRSGGAACARCRPPRARPRSRRRRGSAAARPPARPAPSAASAWSVSPNSSRRSEWPSTTPCTSSSLSIAAETSPVNAPASLVVHVLRVDLDARAARRVDHRAERGERRRRSPTSTRVGGRDRAAAAPAMNASASATRLVHLPVARDQRVCAHVAHCERLHAGQPFALEQLERRAAAGREVVDLVGRGRTARAPRRSRRRRRPSSPGAAATASATRARAGRERLELERAHRAVPEDRAGRGDLGRRSAAPCARPMSRPIQPSGTSTPSSSRRSASAREAVAEHEVARQLAARQPPCRAPSRAPAAPARRPPPRTASRRPSWPCARKNGKHIAPPIRIASAISRKRSITPILSVTFAPPTTATSGCAGVSRIAVSVVHLALQQPPGGAADSRCATPSVRRVRAVRGAERVVDVDVGERGEAARQRRVVLRLARLEADVLEQQHLARRRARAPSAVDLVADDGRARASPRRRVSSRRRAATGASDSSGSRALRAGRGARRGSSVAPRSRSSSIVGSAARMRVSSATCRRASSSGTLKSTRTSTRRPSTSRSSSVLHAQPPTGPSATRSTSAVGVAPLVVVPGDDLHHRPVHHRRQLRVDDRGVRRLDDVGRDDRVLGVLRGSPAADRPRRPPCSAVVDLLDARLALRLDGQVDDRAGRDGRAHREAVAACRSAPGSRARSPSRRRSRRGSG